MSIDFRFYPLSFDFYEIGCEIMNLNKTQMFIPKPVRSATLLLIDNRKTPIMISLSGSATLGRDYPESDRNIRIVSSIVGRKHGEFVHDDSTDTYYYIDNNSLNGTYINGQKLQLYNNRGSKAFRLSDGDIIRIDRSDLFHPHPEAVLMIFSRSFEKNEQWNTVNISQCNSIKIGRSNENYIRLVDDMASRQHAEIQLDYNGFRIFDNNSQNGIFVNGKKIINNIELHGNDVIRIANTVLIFTGNFIHFNNPGERSGCLSVDIHDQTFGKRTIIKDIRFEADTKDFILVLGGSGAGKTTLINAILGETKSNGNVMLDGQSLYENFKTMKYQVGLVPQFVNLRDNDRVISTLMDIADIKLVDYSKKEKQDRIEKILIKLGIQGLKKHLIRQLSGGQKKKVSVAAQLIGFQKVFILDEPDSGLDPASRIQQMEILSDIADSGKIVMVVSHASEEGFDLDSGSYRFSKVLVLAKSVEDNCGELAFYGSTEEALSFFEVKKLKDIIIEINPQNEGGKGKSDYYINKFRGVNHE